MHITGLLKPVFLQRTRCVLAAQPGFYDPWSYSELWDPCISPPINFISIKKWLPFRWVADRECYRRLVDKVCPRRKFTSLGACVLWLHCQSNTAVWWQPRKTTRKILSWDSQRQHNMLPELNQAPSQTMELWPGIPTAYLPFQQFCFWELIQGHQLNDN